MRIYFIRFYGRIKSRKRGIMNRYHPHNHNKPINPLTTRVIDRSIKMHDRKRRRYRLPKSSSALLLRRPDGGCEAHHGHCAQDGSHTSTPENLARRRLPALRAAHLAPTYPQNRIGRWDASAGPVHPWGYTPAGSADADIASGASVRASPGDSSPGPARSAPW